MINRLALSLIAKVMNWNEEKATREYAWLRLMSPVKYDGYSDFRAGVRFLENLTIWLRQFDLEDRPAAYSFVRHRLVYISTTEIHWLIETFVPETVIPYLREAAATEVGIRPYETWGKPDGVKAFKRLLRCSLFIGLSDGSRIDVLRRANSRRLVHDQNLGRLVHDQIVPMLDIGPEKWVDLKKRLKKELGAEARFENVYLIDDFTASGTTFIRQSDTGEWKGKLKKFNDLVCKARDRLEDEFPIAEKYTLHIHHYVSTQQAHEALEKRVADADQKWPEKSFAPYRITQGLLLPADLKMGGDLDEAMLSICDRYYDDHLYQRLKEHCDEAGQTSMKRGYADCALPVILEHNTPNNSVSILWAETSGKSGHKMTPLFRRRDRHG